MNEGCQEEEERKGCKTKPQILQQVSANQNKIPFLQQKPVFRQVV